MRINSYFEKRYGVNTSDYICRLTVISVIPLFLVISRYSSLFLRYSTLPLKVYMVHSRNDLIYQVYYSKNNIINLRRRYLMVEYTNLAQRKE